MIKKIKDMIFKVNLIQKIKIKININNKIIIIDQICKLNKIKIIREIILKPIKIKMIKKIKIKKIQDEKLFLIYDVFQNIIILNLSIFLRILYLLLLK